MTEDLEARLRRWSKPSSDTEAEKTANAIRIVRNAIEECERLAGRHVRVFAQGSYRNNTNVRVESDVDICVECSDSTFSDLPDGVTDADVGLGPATYHYPDFRNDVESALVRKFGRPGVYRGSKAFDVHPNGYRVDADVVAAFEHRRYQRRHDGTLYYEQGIAFLPDQGNRVENWPRQHYENGLIKTDATGNRFKFMVRALKRARYEMEAANIGAAVGVPSFLIECLVWNVPDDLFLHDQYAENMRQVLGFTAAHTETDEPCQEWGEVNELKYLFRLPQPWARQQAHAFVVAAREYLGL